ncbi:MAG TPA: lipid A biosynthesis acyltransferase, partial [Flavisolibacter sp.]|nr:lipid A biosynthesis acyltransferase [Flavisolibacter sp.]
MYYLVYGLLYLLSLLPLRVLFLFSDLAYVVLYYFIGYRKKVVLSNLAIAFPEKTEEVRKQIAKRFYRNFT